MRPTFALASALTLLSAVEARIVGIASPKTVAVGSTVKLEIIAQDYIQSIQDVAIAFGVQQASNAKPDELGTLLGSKYLGPNESNIVGNITAKVQIPSGTPKGETTLMGSLFSLVGALLSPDVENFVVNITVGTHTSSQYVSSLDS